MIRIVGGTFRGRRLTVPGEKGTRPTGDRVREAVFNILSHGLGVDVLTNARVLDLFAGTGALGLEAMSRGAAFALFVERDAAARGLIRQNIEMLELTGATRIFRRDATRLGPIGRMEPFDLAFLDPPYDRGLGVAGLAALHDGGWLRSGAHAVLEEKAGVEIDVPATFSLCDARTYGDTLVVVLGYGVDAT